MIKKGVGGIGAASTLQRSYVKAQIFLYWSFTAPRIMRCECTHAMEPLTFPNQYYTRQILHRRPGLHGVAPYVRAYRGQNRISAPSTELLMTPMHRRLQTPVAHPQALHSITPASQRHRYGLDCVGCRQ